MTMDTVPIIIDDRAMVPLRFIAEALGAEIEWTDWSKTAKITLDKQELIIKANGYLSSGIDVPPVIINDRTFIPLRYVSEKLGANVIWYEDGTIEIYR